MRRVPVLLLVCLAAVGAGPVGHRPAALPQDVGPGLRSPDGRETVFGGEFDCRLYLVDRARQRLVASLSLDRPSRSGCAVTPLAWVASHRVAVSIWSGDAHRTGRSALAIVDPGTRAVSTEPLGIVVAEPLRLPGGGAALLSSPPLGPPQGGIPEERLGPARVIRIGADGRVARLVLTRIRAGFASSRTLNRIPGFALDPDRSRAIVVSEGEGAAEVDLRTLRVVYHPLPHAFDARPRRLASPPRQHRGTNNPSRDLVREAHWVGSGLVAVTGYDNWTHDFRDQTLAAGLKLLDTRRWTVRAVNPRVRSLRFALGTILAWDERPDGLWGYGPAGRLRFHLFSGQQVWVGPIWTRRVPVSVGRRRALVELPSGRVVHAP